MEFTNEPKEDEKERTSSGDAAEPSTEIPKPPEPHTSSKKRKICSFCGASDTPMWRKGPTGKGTLCNACGVKWSIKTRKQTKKKEKTTSKQAKKHAASQGDVGTTSPDSSEHENEDANFFPPLDSFKKESKTASEETLFTQLCDIVGSHLPTEAKESLRKEIIKWKVDFKRREEMRQNMFENLKQQMLLDLSNFRTLLCQKINEKGEKIEVRISECLNTAQHDLNVAEKKIRHGNESTMFHNYVVPLYKSFQQNVQHFGSQLSQDYSQICAEILGDVDTKKEAVDVELESLKHESQLTSSNVKSRVEQLAQ